MTEIIVQKYLTTNYMKFLLTNYNNGIIYYSLIRFGAKITAIETQETLTC